MKIEIDTGMTISELIDVLSKIKEDHGDIRVMCDSGDSMSDPLPSVGTHEYSPALGIGVSQKCVWL